MMPGIQPPPGADMGEAFMAAMFSAVENGCKCESCEILRNASRAWRARLAGK